METKVQHTQEELWIDDAGFIAAGSGDEYHTFADLDCSDRDIDEREANKEHLLRCWNNYYPMLKALKYYKEALAYIYPKLNLKNSFLDAKAIQYMNTMKLKGKAAIKQAEQ